jgi:Phage integrase, N-terminal SAM-like domain
MYTPARQTQPAQSPHSPLPATAGSPPRQSMLPFESGLPESRERPARHMPRLLDQLRAAMLRHHFSIKTEQAVVYWVKFFIRWHGMQHPRELGNREIEAFLSMLRQRSDLPPSSWAQAASALTFLYREVLGMAVTTPTPEPRPTGRSARLRAQRIASEWDWFGANEPQH